MTRKRIMSILESLISVNELSYQIEKDDQSIVIETELGDGTSIKTAIVFDATGEGYVYYTPLINIDSDKSKKPSDEILHSKPFPSITERITKDGNYVFAGSRTGLSNLPISEIERGFLDDFSRVSNFHERLAGDSTTDAPPPENSIIPVNGKKKRKPKGR